MTIRDRLLKKYPDIKLHIDEKSIVDEIHFISIIIPKKQQRKGIGTSIMKSVCKHADKKCKSVVLEPNERLGTSLSVLENFYGNFGFNYENKNKTKWMIRKPRKG